MSKIPSTWFMNDPYVLNVTKMGGPLGVKNSQNLVNVVCECPLFINVQKLPKLWGNVKGLILVLHTVL